MAIINITNLRLRAIIGANDWERDTLQEVIINIAIDFDARKAAKSDQLKDTVDYKIIKKKIMKFVEASRFFLLEKLTQEVLKIVMEDSKVLSATVRIEKPLALRFADSVSLEMSSVRDGKKKVSLRQKFPSV